MPNGTIEQPVNNVIWLDRRLLKANAYNPNHIAPPELELLKVSILEDGWTQPIVIRPDFEIVDGFHRWMISDDQEIWTMTDGMVPVVILPEVEGDLSHQMMSTIRHNRARGSHYVLRMADIVATLLADGAIKEKDLIVRLGMEQDEITRLKDRGNMLKRGSANGFNQGWVPSKEA